MLTATMIAFASAVPALMADSDNQSHGDHEAFVLYEFAQFCPELRLHHRCFVEGISRRALRREMVVRERERESLQPQKLALALPGPEETLGVDLY